jgi:membrane protein
MRRIAHRLLEFFLALAQRLREDRGFETAGSLTFTTLLALVPLVAVALALATPFPAFEHAMAALGRFAERQLLPEGSALVTRQIAEFAEKAGELTSVGLAFIVVTAVLLVHTVEDAFNRIFRVQRRRHLARRLLVYGALLTLGPALIGTSLYLTSTLVVNSLGYLDLDEYRRTVSGLLAFAFTCAALTLVYAVVPYRQVALRHAGIGGLVAGVLFEFAKRGFGLYVAKLPTYTLIYGAFAIIPLFLLWLYVSWVVVLFGATLTAALPAWRVGRLPNLAPKDAT